jgi:pimeloyl-ACP methyl ester carboxylesterase
VFERRPGWRRIYIDPPGTGKSPADPSIADQDGMLAAILALVDDLVGDERFAVAGTSAGALHGRGIVKRDPSRILGLLLRVPGIVVDRTKRTLPTDEYLVRTPEWQEKDRRYYDAVDSIADLDFLGRIQADVSTYSLSEDPAARFEGPTLIVTGRQDTITGYADAWSILDDYPGRRTPYSISRTTGFRSGDSRRTWHWWTTGSIAWRSTWTREGRNARPGALQ